MSRKVMLTKAKAEALIKAIRHCSVRTRNGVYNECGGPDDMWDLDHMITLKRADWMKHRNMGRRSIDELRAVLEANGVLCDDFDGVYVPEYRRLSDREAFICIRRAARHRTKKEMAELVKRALKEIAAS